MSIRTAEQPEPDEPGIPQQPDEPEVQPDIAPQPGRPAPQITNPVGPDPEPSGPGPVVQPGTIVIPGP